MPFLSCALPCGSNDKGALRFQFVSKMFTCSRLQKPVLIWSCCFWNYISKKLISAFFFIILAGIPNIWIEEKQNYVARTNSSIIRFLLIISLFICGHKTASELDKHGHFGYLSLFNTPVVWYCDYVHNSDGSKIFFLVLNNKKL
jgi:hypothetical protein